MQVDTGDVTGSAHASPEIAALIAEYYGKLQAIDPGFSWSDPQWWTNPARCTVIPARGLRGFAIVGYAPLVDDDVASEICELYCRDSSCLLHLLRSCLPHLRPPFGFQVLRANTRARKVIERLLRRFARELSFTMREATEDACQVIKYRCTLAPDSRL